MPSHMVGLWSTGKVRAGDGRITYDAFAGNGPMIDMEPASGVQAPGTLNINAAGDNNHQAMVGFNLGYEFSGAMEGLRLGIHALRGDVDDDSDGTLPGSASLNKTGLSMTGALFAYLENDWEILGEYYRFNNKDRSGGTGTHSSWADYLQAGRSFGAMTPFLRVEKAVLSQRDNYFSMQDSGQSYARQALGLKYDLNQKASLKVELLSSKFAADTGRLASSYRSLLAQYAIRF